MKSRYAVFICAFLWSIHVCGQDTIHLQNPSFEDFPRRGYYYSAPINSWNDCGLSAFPGESPPDIHPVPVSQNSPKTLMNSGGWGVTESPQHGDTYLGLVARYNNTYESVSQHLNTPLQAGKCYSFQLYLSVAEIYKSGTQRSRGKPENFTEPLVLRIWGGNQFCERKRLLGESIPVSNIEWNVYDFLFYPGMDLSYITFEAYYEIDRKAAYNGHILIDNLSPIIEVPCK